jgi:hypothetical protein
MRHEIKAIKIPAQFAYGTGMAKAGRGAQGAAVAGKSLKALTKVDDAVNDASIATIECYL